MSPIGFNCGDSVLHRGEHYVVDVLLGWLYAAGAVVGIRWGLARRENAESPHP